MKARWASRQHDELRAAIWSWLTSPANEQSAPRARRVRQVAYAFELWIAHLMMLERLLDISPVTWDGLLAAEAEGLEILRAEKQRYAREFRSCEECGSAVRGKICQRCGAVSRRSSQGN